MAKCVEHISIHLVALFVAFLFSTLTFSHLFLSEKMPKFRNFHEVTFWMTILWPFFMDGVLGNFYEKTIQVWKFMNSILKPILSFWIQSAVNECLMRSPKHTIYTFINVLNCVMLKRRNKPKRGRDWHNKKNW